MSHTEKVVDGIPIKYICEPCPECKAKLEEYSHLENRAALNAYKVGLGAGEYESFMDVVAGRLVKAKLKAAEELLKGLKYLADESNWDNDQDGYRLIRPGGFRQEGIFQVSRNLNPWLFAKDVVTAWEKVAQGET